MARKQEKPTFTLTLPLDTTISDDSALEKYFELSRKYYNAILGKLNNRVKFMQESKEFNKLRKLPKTTERTEAFKELEIKYGLRGTAINKLITSLRVNEFKDLGSHITIQLELRAMQSINKVRFDNGDKIHFIKYGEMTSIQGSDNKQGIRYRDGIIMFNKLKMPVIINSNDIYAQQAIQSRVKYCRILRKFSKTGIKYYIQLVMEGLPPQKHKIGIGEVGIDIGTQTIGICSDNDVKLFELAEGINKMEFEKLKLQRKLDRQRRANNPNKYNIDGTINTHNRDKWIKSNNYIKTQSKIRDINRRIANTRKQKHEEMANYILSLGNIIKVETMSFSGLQRKAKKTTINKNGKFNKKKRFGKSLGNKAPAKLLEIINRKLKYQGIWLFKVNTYKIKASQYNPFSDEHIKKDLSVRWNYFNINNQEVKIQRDLMSALIIKNVIIDGDLTLDKIDRDNLINEFDSFKILHDKEIERLRNLPNKLLSSMGI